ncbi:50S ribosomal protein L9 [Tistrella bauzanensis]|uniref:Large ribosomal subunit protein bL9 n=1 Tax=Tistrella arctica TaxID=3133430 RepID=A0ABU9YE37_9PROT
MEVILLERIQNLGQIGDRVKVRPGYARNFLLPQRKALRATKENLGYFETQRKALVALNDTRRSEAEILAEKLLGQVLPVVRQAADNGQLYGSVTARDVSLAVESFGLEVSGRQVQLREPIKTLGTQTVSISLHPDVVVDVTICVVRSMDDFANQQRRATETEDQLDAAYEVAEGSAYEDDDDTAYEGDAGDLAVEEEEV